MALRDSIRIMVVDDMSTSRGLLMQALDELGIRQVDYAADGRNALTKLAANPVHLVISDYNMPQMDGLHLLKALRENRTTSRIGFILVTGRADREIIETGQRLGMNNFLRKPFSTQQMRACIQAVVGAL
ncbi:chemotaxis protein CheY [Defluviimonas sp. 20V17]|uniref:Response regulator n=1 Tax=Allgaiera indica TaxID=765699 RepID=A0AAN4UPG9_9RHOB|nr:response regulator [Allgaiera indica]KDB04004.1 chemotaxis protein CheY [Defluviimonas sp. 20V17]GHD99348.1 response regulator [Allgaiera indica]SDW28376.1 two-component system, chemotaxis family, response regulator CheY [Allgaiera indica]